MTPENTPAPSIPTGTGTNATALAESPGLSRRQFTTAAAWAAPVIALAVATPLAAASTAPTPSITISRDNTVTFTGVGETRDLAGNYGGTLSVTDLAPGAETGALTFTVGIPSGVVVTPTVPADWSTVTTSPTLLVFAGPSLSSTYTTTELPDLAFSGTITTGDLITLSIDAANPGYQVADDQLGVS
ncbi:hypothetical protein N1031_14265 [Herbiconiux moechotypicola]|uniref:Uncharacterized protein n=1 Tax=Herbiconiux moechotypicola TaxID=637393 RepID=A0ABN3DWI6_9MICO|nr:hypothetical protein [Herbiconiux moechotypicola]MCS5730927.1 hypothetical protein [Herbiconiux moechotypicola]